MQVLRDDAYKLFKRRLLAGDLRPGQFVTQKELADMIGVSMNPAREAIQRLQFERLLEVYPKRGIQIAVADPKTVNDAYDFRILLETQAIRRFAERAPVERIHKIVETTESLIRTFASSPDNEDVLLDTAEGDWNFHEEIIDFLDNQFISEHFRLNSARIRLCQRNNGQSRQRLGPALEEHLELLAACERRQVAAATKLINRHIETSRAFALGTRSA